MKLVTTTTTLSPDYWKNSLYFCFHCSITVKGDNGYRIDNQVYCKKCYNNIQRKDKLNKLNEGRRLNEISQCYNKI